jgi:hypothetical protein
VQVEQNGGHPEAEQPKRRWIRCRILDVSSGFVHGDGSVSKERATMQVRTATPLKALQL